MDEGNKSVSQYDEQNEQIEQETERVFTQEEVNKLISERLKRERSKYADYADLKKAAEEYQKLKESQMSETEKLQEKLAEYERQLLEKEREAAEARLEMLKLKVLDEMGLPKAWATRILGTTEDEIKADAEELKKLLGVSGKAIGSGTNPPAGTGLENPWKKETYNLTKQGEILKSNPALAQRLMAEAGVKF